MTGPYRADPARPGVVIGPGVTLRVECHSGEADLADPQRIAAALNAQALGPEVCLIGGPSVCLRFRLPGGNEQFINVEWLADVLDGDNDLRRGDILRDWADRVRSQAAGERG